MTRARMCVSGAALLALGLYLSGVGLAADEAVEKDILKLAEAIAKKDEGAKKQAEAIAKKNYALEDIMGLMSKGGVKLGTKPDGIESKLLALDKTPPTAAALAADAAALEKAAQISIAIAIASTDMVPKPKKKDEKAWKTFLADMQKTSAEFADAVKPNKPDAVQKAAKKLNNVCIGCHDKFRD